MKSFNDYISEQRGGKNILSQDSFIERCKEIHSDENGNPLYDYSLVNYVNSYTPVKVMCNNVEHRKRKLEETGTEYFLVTPSKHLQGSSKCPYEDIRKERKYSDEDLEREARKYTSTKEFKSLSPKMWHRAVKNPEFYKKITSHFKSDREWMGEKFVESTLQTNNFVFEKQKTFDGCLSERGRKLKFDFFLPDINTCIEYDGEQHFKVSNLFGLEKFEMLKKNDIIKNKFCQENNIKLIRIHYKLPFQSIEDELIRSIESDSGLSLLGPY